MTYSFMFELVWEPVEQVIHRDSVDDVCNVERARVPGGWIYKFMVTDSYRDVVGDSTSTRLMSTTFVPETTRE